MHNAFGKPKPSRDAGPEMDDILRAQQGDAAAFERIYRLHSKRVYALCLRMVRDAAQAEDLTQEAFLHLFRKIHTFRGDSAFSTWLHRLCVNIVLMRLRKKSLIGGSLDQLTDTDDETGSPGQQIGERDLRLSGTLDRIRLQRAINQLAPGYKAMFLLHDVEGYEHEEIAAMLGCTVGNSKSQLHKARLRLRELLHDTERDAKREERRADASAPASSAARRRTPIRMNLAAANLAAEKA